MKKNCECFSGGLIIAITLLVGASIICIVRSDCFSSNMASIIGGVLGAFATVCLGAIAFWQNKRYKELSDELNERIYMPELYKAAVLTEQLSGIVQSGYNKFSFQASQADSNPSKTIYCEDFKVLHSPILNIAVKSIKCAGMQLLLQGESHSLYEDRIAFSLFLTVPEDFVRRDTKFEITFTYENIYGTQYEKIAFFTVNEELTTATDWKMDRARRIK